MVAAKGIQVFYLPVYREMHHQQENGPKHTADFTSGGFLVDQS